MERRLNFIRYSFVGLSLILTMGCGQTKIVKNQNVKVGSDRDKHGCIASAGYTWSEAQQNCIRLFEKGIRLEAVKGKETCFIVFSPDSLKAELFFEGNTPPEILERRTLPNGSFVWNVEDDDTKNVSFTDGKWTITRRGKLIYTEKR